MKIQYKKTCGHLLTLFFCLLFKSVQYNPHDKVFYGTS